MVIAGGNGQVGHILARHFYSRSDSVVVLARGITPEPWRMVRGPWVSELEGADTAKLILKSRRVVPGRLLESKFHSNFRLAECGGWSCTQMV
jgi:NAD dependent epimerase/dehydratase family enzyme